MPFSLIGALTPALWAGGFEGSGVGARALSMGGAFVGLADDWSASFWNPAGLAFLKSSGIGGSVDFLSLRALDGNSIANPLPPISRSNVEQGDPFFQLGGEPSRFGVTDTTIHAALPSVAGYVAWRGWAFSSGAYAPLGFAFELEDSTVPDIRANYKSEGYIVMYNFSAARKLGEHLSFGAGLNFLDARLKRDAQKETGTYTSSVSTDGRGQSVQGVFGLMIRPTATVSLGFSFKSASDINMEGAATVTDSRYPLTLSGVGTLQNESSAQESVLHAPASYTAGFAWRPAPFVVWTFDWEGTDWRPTRVKIHFDRPGAALQDQDFNAGWRFTNRLRAGGEWRFPWGPRHGVELRWGYTWDPYAVPDSAVSVTNIVDVSRHVYTLGLGWHWGVFEPAIAFAYGQGSRTISGVDYKKVDRLLSAGLQYKI